MVDKPLRTAFSKCEEIKMRCQGVGCRGNFVAISRFSNKNQKLWHKQKTFNKSLDANCMDCNHPPCKYADQPFCRTCKTCRAPECNKKVCLDEPAPLNGKQLRICKEDITKYVCERCEGFFCIKCGSKMTKIQRERKRGRASTDDLKTREQIANYICKRCESARL